MSRTFRITLLTALCAAACACQPGDDDTAAARPDAASADTPPATADAAAGAFTCDDGSTVNLAWGADSVVVSWPDGRTATLPKAESASGPDGDAYVGDTVSVEHSGDRIVLRDGGKAALTCNAADATGASAGDATITMRYDCEPDTRVTVFSDDSAHVALPDGQYVTMRRIAGSEPPTFTGGSLYFAIGETDAHLSQGDETNELACNPA